MTRQPIDRALMRDVWAHLRDRDHRPRAALPEGRGQLRVTDEAGVAEVYLYDEIGFWGVMASEFVEQLLGIAANRIVLHINSPGGDVFDGVAIYNALVDHPATIEVKVDGAAFSAASFIAQAGDSRVMNRGSEMMIHDAAGFCIGNASDMQTMVELLDRCSNTIAGIYAARCGGEVGQWREAMRGESWYSAREAVEAGLADSAVAEKSAENKFDLRMTSFHFAGRAAAPRPPMPARATNQLPVEPGVDGATENGDGSAPRAEPVVSEAPVDWSALAAAFAALTPKEAAT